MVQRAARFVHSNYDQLAGVTQMLNNKDVKIYEL